MRLSLLLVRSSVDVGLTTAWPSQYPTRTAATGVVNGISERISAQLAPVMARVSESFSRSAERSRPMTCVSFVYPSGNSGRSGRSIMREVRISFSLGRPSRLKKPPGILPAA